MENITEKTTERNERARVGALVATTGTPAAFQSPTAESDSGAGGGANAYRFTANGRVHELPAGVNHPITVRDVLVLLGIKGQHFAVALNLHFVPRGQYETTLVKSGDSLEIVSPMQGG